MGLSGNRLTDIIVVLSAFTLVAYVAERRRLRTPINYSKVNSNRQAARQFLQKLTGLFSCFFRCARLRRVASSHDTRKRAG